MSPVRNARASDSARCDSSFSSSSPTGAEICSSSRKPCVASPARSAPVPIVAFDKHFHAASTDGSPYRHDRVLAEDDVLPPNFHARHVGRYFRGAVEVEQAQIRASVSCQIEQSQRKACWQRLAAQGPRELSALRGRLLHVCRDHALRGVEHRG
eukprot:scaffold128_cov248-Pinguiococcus_pyrenoidosus.AAC.43